MVGFAVLLDIYQKRKWQKLSINSKLVLVTTGFLILIGSVFIFILEYGNQNTLGDLGLFDKVMVSTFMASMARTSGFSMLDIGSLTEPSLLLIMFLMFIGGSPASTGGGIKTTTIAVIFAAIWSLIRGREDVVIFERTVPPIVIFRAMSIFFVSAIVVFLMSMFLCLTEDIALSKILFESVSMFATVGLDPIHHRNYNFPLFQGLNRHVDVLRPFPRQLQCAGSVLQSLDIILSILSQKVTRR